MKPRISNASPAAPAFSRHIGQVGNKTTWSRASLLLLVHACNYSSRAVPYITPYCPLICAVIRVTSAQIHSSLIGSDKCTMWLSSSLVLLVATATAQYTSPPANNSNSLGPDENGKYEISAEGIRGLFIPYGASISNLFVKGKDGEERDIVLGFDSAAAYEGKVHPHFGGVPGRYANRIKNSSFVIDGTEYHVLPNENNNNNTLHGGPDGWDHRNFTVVAHTENSITFSIVDPDGKEGFPGEVVSYVTYTMTPNTWSIRISALATTKKTPIMLTSHVSAPLYSDNRAISLIR
ncbi:hypothetical protein J1614_010098 [Plenodomus biglobosus]|nr:hypothetical protein J1614_010098 [Plenodomus biglobosus]